MNAVSLAGVTYTYPGAAGPALCDVDLKIVPGELVVVAGGSGSGKSTLLRVISGLVPHFYGGTYAGRATIAGMDTRDHGPGELAAAVGTLFQDPESQVVMGTVRAELAFGLENRGVAPAAVARAVEETALALAIESLLERSTAELSGGELQRVALGAALAGRPAVVVLDEPTSQLDPVAGDELIGLLRRANEDFDATIILAEHRLERCLGAADRVLALAGGRVVCDADPTVFLEWASRSAPPLQTPGAKLLGSLGLTPVPGVKRARAALRARQLLPEAASGGGAEPSPAVVSTAGVPTSAVAPRSRRLSRRRPPSGGAALELRRVWHELRSGPAILRDVSLTVAPGERIALMGRNGAGKSTLLRHAAGLMDPTRGTLRTAGRVALLLQNPTDYLVHESVDEEAPAAALAAAGLDAAALGRRHPRDLSGGEKQRLALAVVLGEASDPPAAVCLDEPTRGMGRDHKDDLARLLTGLDAAVVVATHDPEFASAFAERVVLLADGAVIADGSTAAILSGGSYFATETARILGGAGGALTPEEGWQLLVDRLPAQEAVV
ncbi:MAG TPA: ATP-binding cassette domain-containing protein [Solirubrobacteraceae bacterium]|nr:ATP-binding cassette domain-containing protein [Solirubrobacteraceae bacterium]